MLAALLTLALPSALTYDLYPGDTAHPPSVERLSESLTINGATATPTLRYTAGDVDYTTWHAWTYGATLTLAGSGTVPYHNQQSPLLGSIDNSVLFNIGKAFQAAASTTGDVTTQDPVIRVLFEFSGTNGQVLAEKKAAGVGYTLSVTGGKLRLVLTDGTHTANVDTAALTTGERYLAVCYVRKAGSAQWYVNDVVSGAAVSVSTVGSLTNAGLFTLGADSSLANGYGARVEFFELYKSASWLDTHLQATVDTSEFDKLTRIDTTCAGTCAPTTVTYPESWLRKWRPGSRQAFMMHMGAGWPRVERSGYVQGLYSEIVATNSVKNSEDLSAGTWTKLTAGDVIVPDDPTMPFPYGSTSTCDALVPSTGNGDHGFTTVSATHYIDNTWSGFFRAGSFSWMFLGDDSFAAPGDGCYFNLAACDACTADGMTYCTGAVGTLTGLTRLCWAVNYGNHVCRVGLTTEENTQPEPDHTLRWELADGDLDRTTTGDGVRKAIYACGFQEENNDTISSYIATGSAVVTRSASLLAYAGGANTGTTAQSIVCSVGSFPKNNVGNNGQNTLFTILHDTDNYEMLATFSSVFTANALSVSGAAITCYSYDHGNLASVAVNDGNRFVQSFSMTAGAFHNRVNGTLQTDADHVCAGGDGTTPLSSAMPVGASTAIYVGSVAAGAAAYNGWIERCQISDTAGVTGIVGG